jgi:hypothetical protein
MKTLDPREAAAIWPERERQWRVALGRIKIGVEPIGEQVEKYRLVTWMITALAAGIGLMFVALFSAFRHPMIGLTVAVVLFGPLILSAWIGFLRLKAKAARYVLEKQEVERLRSQGVV